MNTNNTMANPITNTWKSFDLDVYILSNDREEAVVRPRMHICINDWSRMIVNWYVTFHK